MQAKVHDAAAGWPGRQQEMGNGEAGRW
jgi:hypothetical protein